MPEIKALKVPSECSVEYAVKVDVYWQNQEQAGNDERDHQSFESFPSELSGAAFGERKIGADAGNNKEQWHNWNQQLIEQANHQVWL